jgi:hypothetical protein
VTRLQKLLAVTGATLILPVACDRDAPPGPANRAPVITSEALQQATEGSLFTFVLQFNDPDGPDTLIAFSGTPSWLTVSGDTVSGIAGDNDHDTSFVVTVSDGLAADTLAVLLVVLNINDPPVILCDDTLYASSGVAFSFHPQVIDPDNTTFSISFPHVPAWSTADSDSVYGIPPDTARSDSIKVIVSDGQYADTAAVFLRLLPPLAVYGDSRTGHDAHIRIVSQLLAVHPAVVFHSGDLVEDGTSETDWDIFKAITADLRAQAEFFPALGNHELQSQLFFDNFDLPGNEQWYSVERNRVHFTIINSCVDISSTSDQYQWLVEDLSSVDDSIWFRAVVFHHPPYSTGAHYAECAYFRSILVPVFAQYGVDIVFNGHDHDYERSHCDDIHYIVTGGGGAPLRDQASYYPCSQLFIKQFHFCKLSVLPEAMFIRVIDDVGETIDEFSVPASP